MIHEVLGLFATNEVFHGVVTLIIVRPFADALDAVLAAIPAVMIADALGVAICVIALERIFQEFKGRETESVTLDTQN
jgi:hypothetical protein